jgi:hypothetical protein
MPGTFAQVMAGQFARPGVVAKVWEGGRRIVSSAATIALVAQEPGGERQSDDLCGCRAS